MSNNQFTLAYTTDLNEGLRVVPIQPVFISGDDKAHCFVISVNRNGKEEKLTGTTVRGYFIRPDNVTIMLDGEVNEAGQAVLSPDSACYKKQGRFQVVIRAIIDGVKSTVFCGEGRIILSATDSFIDEEDIVPSLDDLLAQIATIEDAVNRANAAADKANSAVGATPNLTIGTVETLAPGSEATATITGTPEDPVLNLGLPRGTDGMGAVRTVNGQAGDVMLAASDVGALPDTYEAPVSSVNDKTGAVSLVPSDVGAAPATEDATYPGCYYRMVNGEKEWINPPLVAGVEYRTTERYTGKPVYTKLIDCGTSADNKSIQFNVTKTKLIDIKVVIGTFLANQRPAGDTAKGSDYYAEFYITSAGVTLYCGASKTGQQSYAQIWYIN